MFKQNALVPNKLLMNILKMNIFIVLSVFQASFWTSIFKRNREKIFLFVLTLIIYQILYLNDNNLKSTLKG